VARPSARWSGAAYAAGDLDRFEQWVLGLGLGDVLSYMDIGFSGGLLRGERLMEFFRRSFTDHRIEDLPMRFAAVATALETGAEVWLREGSTLDAVRASMALPGLLAPVTSEGVVLVDGGLVNPVPVSLARAMGADMVVAVDLNSDIVGRHLRQPIQQQATPSDLTVWMRKVQDNLGAYLPTASSEEPKLPSMLDVLASSINIMQVRITRSRMAGEPPDLVVAPRLSHLGLLDFHRAKDAIEAGKRAVERVAHLLPFLTDPAS
jgi:NTE family protein